MTVMSVLVGQTISHYKILEYLGGGGMGIVYKAEDTRLKRTVALKFLPPDLTRDPEAKRRFIHEAQAASALQHGNICVVYDIDETDEGQVFISLEHLTGETLKRKIEAGPLNIGPAIDIAMQVAQGLAKAHEQGIVHRDIKPANIIVTNDGVAKIVDFGLAKLSGQSMLTKAGSTVGTAAYMSPEQARGEDIDCRTDIWSLGVVLHEMITGQLPFKGEYENAIIYSILNVKPGLMSQSRSGVPVDLQRIVDKCLEKERDKRYQTALDLLPDLRRLKPIAHTGVSSRREIMTNPRKRLKSGYIIAGTVVAVLAAVALFLLYLKSGMTVAADKSIAVLPFENLSESKGDEYFADGITEDIITQLSKIADLKVISRTSVMQYKGISRNVRDIGKDLDVGTVLEGSVRRAGDQVRIVAELIDARNEGHIWADTYDEKLTQIFAIQSDVAQSIASVLRAKLLPSEKERIEKTHTANTEAYQVYLKGRFYWNKRRGDDLKTAITYFNQAIERDPTYPLPYAALASTYVILPEYAGLPLSECIPKAEAAAKRALEFDSTLSEPHAVLALINETKWDWLGAQREFKQAIQLNPNDPTARQWYSICLRDLCLFDEASAEIKRAQELDPLSLVIDVNVGDDLYARRQYDRAIEQFRKTLELDSSFALAHRELGSVYDVQGRFNEAIAELQKARSIVGKIPDDGWSRLGHAYARAGNRNAALKIIQQLNEFSNLGYSMTYDIAFVYYGLGDKEKAFTWLEKAYQEKHYRLTEMKQDPSWDGLRADPRFIGLLRKLGLEK